MRWYFLIIFENVSSLKIEKTLYSSRFLLGKLLVIEYLMVSYFNIQLKNKTQTIPMPKRLSPIVKNFTKLRKMFIFCHIPLFPMGLFFHDSVLQRESPLKVKAVGHNGTQPKVDFPLLV